jgi:Asp-tRNA(Asn)/Glu-tRNA(Gln) amidotransferase A subunit family amidase
MPYKATTNHSTATLWRRSARELAPLLQSRGLRAIDVVEAYLTRKALREPTIHAWASIDPD